jgi:hypothetical protein
MRPYPAKSRLLWCSAACSLLLAAACTDEAASPDPATDPVDQAEDDPVTPDDQGDDGDGDDGTGSGSGSGTTITTTAAIASQMAASWQDDRPGAAGVVEFARFRFHGDVVPTSMAAMTWTPTISVSLYIHKTNFNAGTAERVEVIEPQAATLVSSDNGAITVALADGTTLQMLWCGFQLTNVSAARAQKLSGLTYWPELQGFVSGATYSLAPVGSYVTTVLPTTVYDTLDVPAVQQPYGLEKNLVVGDVRLNCLRSTSAASSSCTLQVQTTGMVAVDATDVTYRAGASGTGVDEIVEALATVGGTIAGDNGTAETECASGACTFTWKRARPTVTFP